MFCSLVLLIKTINTFIICIWGYISFISRYIDKKKTNGWGWGGWGRGWLRLRRKLLMLLPRNELYSRPKRSSKSSNRVKEIWTKNKQLWSRLLTLVNKDADRATTILPNVSKEIWTKKNKQLWLRLTKLVKKDENRVRTILRNVSHQMIRVQSGKTYHC